MTCITTPISSANRNNITECINKFGSIGQATRNLPIGASAVADNITNLQNTLEQFHKSYENTNLAQDLFYQMATDHLTDSCPEDSLDWGAKAVRSMLGIISKEIRPEDKARFDKVYSEFRKNHSHFDDNKKIGKDLTFLFSKYGAAALRKQALEYTENCRNAWRYHNVGHDQSTPDEVIFNRSIEVCYDVMECHLNHLTKKEISWTDLICFGRFFTDSCVSISKTLKDHHTAPGTSPADDKSGNKQPEFTRADVPHAQGMGNSLPADNGFRPINITVHGSHASATCNGQHFKEPQVQNINNIYYNFYDSSSNNLDPEGVAKLVKDILVDGGWVSNKGHQERIIDHVDSVVSNLDYTSTSIPLLSPSLARSSILMQETDTVPLQVVFHEQKDKPQNAVYGDTKLLDSAAEVARTLSSLIDETGLLADEHDISTHDIERKKSQIINQQKLVNPFKNVEITVKHQHNESIFNKRDLDNTNSSATDRSLVSRSVENKSNARNPREKSKWHNTIVHHAPLFTTNRTIDPFSRRSLHLQPASKVSIQRNEMEEEQQNIGLEPNLVNSL